MVVPIHLPGAFLRPTIPRRRTGLDCMCFFSVLFLRNFSTVKTVNPPGGLPPPHPVIQFRAVVYFLYS